MLALAHLTRRFGDHLAVNDVSFTVEEGRMTGFVGANGAGKTTTMRMIMGVLAIDSGEVQWQGRPITPADRRRFGYMPEERGLYPKQPIIDQLVYLARLQGFGPARARQQASGLLDRFNLGDRGKDKLESLSLGNQQRVQIAAAVISEPQMLVLDEPFSGLDPIAVDEMADLLREFTSRGAPVLFSSHQLDLVERLCDRLIVLRSGEVVASGSAAELRRRETVRHRLVTGGDAGWVRDLPGLTVVDVEGNTAIVELAGQEDTDRLLTEALHRGSVREFAEVIPSLAEIYREVTA